MKIADNKFGNSILRAFSDSGIDVKEGDTSISEMVKMDGIDMIQDLPYLYMAVMAK